MPVDFSKLKRPHYPMPAAVRGALIKRGLMKKYRARPAYQQNDYIGWINRAKHADTRQQRIDQMLDELEQGNAYMRMKWNAR